MKKRLLAFFCMLALAIAPAAAFSDTETHWAKDSIQEMTDRGVVNGYPDGSFRPNGAVRYGEAAKMICLAAGLAPKTDSGHDTAGMTGHWAAPYLRALPTLIIERDMNTGSETVKPDNPINREDVAYTIALLLAGPTAASDAAEKFKDFSSIETYKAPGVGYTAEKGIITGYEDGTFRPQGTITRAEMCAILLRAFPEPPADTANDDE